MTTEGPDYLPEWFRDFHVQKDFFKEMHRAYEGKEEPLFSPPNWIDGHMYTIDWFLYRMAQKGYKLQKIRAKSNDN